MAEAEPPGGSQPDVDKGTGSTEGGSMPAMVPPCRMIVRATAGARVIGKQGANIKAGSKDDMLSLTALRKVQRFET